MEIKRMVKRLFAIGTGITMLGATAMGALAADLSEYPKMFVSSGTFNGFFVVGENAKPIDNLAMTDIAASMQYLKPSTAGTTTTLQGDVWLANTGSKKLELTNSNATASSIGGENLYGINTFLGKDEVKALGDGTYTTNGGTYGYSQYLYFDKNNDNQNEIVKYIKSSDDETSDFFFVKNSANIGEYRLEFTSTPSSTVQDTSGSVSTSGTVIDDFEKTKLKFMGKDYNIVLARRPASRPQDSIKFTLMGGATSGSLLEGESTKVKLASTEYEVTLSYVDNTYAKFTVNGEQTNKLQVGDTYKLSSGKEIGVSEILYQSYAGGIHSSDFFLGASKVEMRDNNIRDNSSSNTLTVGSDSISGADVSIQGTDDNTTVQLTSIRVNMTAQDAYYVAPNGKLSEVMMAANARDKNILFPGSWDVQYTGLTNQTMHDIKLHTNSDRRYYLQYYDGGNNKVDMPLFYANTSTSLHLGEEQTEKDVILNEAWNISKNDYFVVSAGTASSGTARTYTLQYKGADKNTASSPKIRFKDLGTDNTLEYAVDTGTTGNTVATIKLGGYSFEVRNVSDKATSDFDVRVDLDGDGSMEDATAGSTAQEVDIVDYYGALIDFGGKLSDTNSSLAQFKNGSGGTSGGNAMNMSAIVPHIDGAFNYSWLNISVPNTNDFDSFTPSTLKVEAGAVTTNKVNVLQFFVDGANATSGTSNPSVTPEGETNIGYGYTSMGAKWTYTTPSGSPQEFVLSYPQKQRLPQVYITASGVSSSSSEGGDLTPVTVVDATKLDSEVADAKAQNLVVVGGPCVNTVAAELLGSPATCTEGFTPGKARVKLFEHANGNMAMLVAGYSGADTRLAGKVLAHRWKELSGKEVEVEGTTYSDATIAAPSAKPAAASTAADTGTAAGNATQ